MRGYPLHRVLAPRAAFLGGGDVRGRLVDLGRYPGLIDGAGVCVARSTGWTTLNFSRCSIGRRGTISSVAARSSHSRTAGARGRGSTATAGHRIGRSPSRTGTTGGRTPLDMAVRAHGPEDGHGGGPRLA